MPFTFTLGSLCGIQSPGIVSWLLLASCSVLYFAAIFGYIAYGDRAESTILNNLPKDVFTEVGTNSLSPTSSFTAPIPLSSFALEIERLTDITIIRRGNVIYRTIIRSAIIEACGCIGCSVPYFSDFLSSRERSRVVR
ncbi:hypothetical protein CPC16_008969 [Podila verticillata]|nr:hypothetical protein CPC16_008969 [Podila verticillata]